MDCVRVGVVGLGEVAQTIHLPILAADPERYEITAVCDVSAGAVALMGDRYSVEGRHTDVAELVARDDVDAVFVLASDEYHAEFAIAACRAGKHVFVEKPVCLTPSDLEAVIDARDHAGVQLMVGYMRRFAPAFVAAVDEVRTWTDITYARFRDLIGPNRLLIDQAHRVHRFDDIPPAAVRERADRARAMVEEAIGPVAQPLQNAYRLLCGLNSHDLSAMREIIGVPRAVANATAWRNGRFLHVVFDYDGYYAVLETGVDEQTRFDASIEIHSPLKSVKVQYDTPYLRQLPTTLTSSETVGDAYVQTVDRPTFKDAYVCELEAFHETVVHDVTPKTSAEDAMEDLQLFRRIISALQQ